MHELTVYPGPLFKHNYAVQRLSLSGGCYSILCSIVAYTKHSSIFTECSPSTLSLSRQVGLGPSDNEIDYSGSLLLLGPMASARYFTSAQRGSNTETLLTALTPSRQVIRQSVDASTRQLYYCMPITSLNLQLSARCGCGVVMALHIFKCLGRYL